MKEQIRPALLIFALLTLLTGLVYPALVTAIAQTLFSWQANGSVLTVDGKPVGSALIGQPFSGPRYFWGRPSATGPMAYNAAASTGSNLGPTNPAQLDAVKARVAVLRAAHPDESGPIPIDLVTASGSGLDSHVSPAAAAYQASRVARARGLPLEQIQALITRCTEGRTLGLLGEPRVNVLQLNLALDVRQESSE